RALFGGFNGLSGSIKSPWLANKTATYEYSGYIIPEEFNIAKCHVVVGVMSNENKFLNAAKISLEEATASVTLNADHKVMISPNPIYGTSYIQVNNPNAEDLSIKMYNNFGVMVASQNYGRLSGLNSLPIVSDNLGSGTYFIHVLIGNERVVKQIAVVK
ncbi:MAG: T9SS type A sorting domain-containing protein, partial [Saprospiraceae bacterium]|nr:T9SS type A sorting domain-containing protein [Saprospiraceae bacterium]